MLFLLVTFAGDVKTTPGTWLLVLGVALQVPDRAFHNSPTQVATVQAAVVVIILLIMNEIKVLLAPALPRNRDMTEIPICR